MIHNIVSVHIKYDASMLRAVGSSHILGRGGWFTLRPHVYETQTEKIEINAVLTIHLSIQNQ